MQKRMTEVNVKFILVVRNPFDPISFIMIRGQRSFENAIEHYFSNCAMVNDLRKRIGSENLIAMRYEDFINHPKTNLAAVCRFLGLAADEEYLDACASILHATPEQGRHLVNWEEKWIKQVERQMKQFDFLDGYSFVG
jgi:hypothetical protein